MSPPNDCAEVSTRIFLLIFTVKLVPEATCERQYFSNMTISLYFQSLFENVWEEHLYYAINSC